MSNSVNKNKAFIKLLLETQSEEQRQLLFDTATPNEIQALSEICLNICRGRFNNKLCKIDKTKRCQFIEDIRPIQKAASTNISFRKKRKAISKAHREVVSNQKGAGIFSILLPLAATLLPELLGA